MSDQIPMRGSRISVAISFLAVSTLILFTGCIKTPDMTEIKTARAKPIQRHDTMQAIAIRGDMVVAGTQTGNVLVSSDAGKNWTRVALGDASFIDLTVCPDGTFLGLDFYHKLWSSSANARSWKAHPIAEPRTPLTVTCALDSIWWVAGTNATLASSKDAGATWKTTDLAIDAQLTALQFFDQMQGLAVGEFGIVFATEDGGKSWVKRATIPNDFYPYAMLFVSPSEGWVSGLAGQIMHTTDSGVTWSKQDNLSQQALYRLFLHNNIPHGVGAAGTIARLEGDSWKAVPSRDVPPSFLAGGASLPNQSALIVGGPRGLLMTVSATPSHTK